MPKKFAADSTIIKVEVSITRHKLNHYSAEMDVYGSCGGMESLQKEWKNTIYTVVTGELQGFKKKLVSEGLPEDQFIIKTVNPVS